MPNENLNYSSMNYVDKEYYEKQLLERAKTVYLFGDYGQKRSIPKNNGKKVEFRKFNAIPVDMATAELSEGVTPDGKSLSQTHIEATVKEYGAYVTTTDWLELMSYDPIQSEAIDLLADYLADVLNRVVRDAILSECSVDYVGDATSSKELEATDVLTINDIRKVVRSLDRNKAKKFTANGQRSPHYVCICSPEAAYDLMSDSKWQNPHQYADVEAIYSGELGRMYGVVFVQNTECKVDKQSVLLTVASTASKTITFDEEFPEEAIAYLKAGAKFKIGTTEYTVASINADNKAITVSETLGVDVVDGAIAFSEDAGKPDATTKAAPDVHHTMVFGADAYGIIDIAGAGSIETIVKQKGEGGFDPLNQRASIGAKCTAFTAKVLAPLWVFDIRHCVSA